MDHFATHFTPAFRKEIRLKKALAQQEAYKAKIARDDARSVPEQIARGFFHDFEALPWDITYGLYGLLDLGFKHGNNLYLEHRDKHPLSKYFSPPFSKDTRLPNAKKIARAHRARLKIIEDRTDTFPISRTVAGNIGRASVGLVPLAQIPKGISKGSRLALEVLTPTLTSKTPLGIAASTVPNFALQQTFTNIVYDDEPDAEPKILKPPEFTSNKSGVLMEGRKFRIVPDEPKKSIPQEDLRVREKNFGKIMTGKKFKIVRNPDGMLVMPSQGKYKGVRDPNRGFIADNAQLIVLGVLGALAGGYAITRLRSGLNAKRQNALQEVTGQHQPVADNGIMTPAAISRIQLSHNDAGIYKALRDVGLDEEEILDFVHMFRTTTLSPSLAGRITHIITTGELPNSTIVLPRLNEHLDVWSKMTNQQRASYNEALTLGTRLDDMNLKGAPQEWKRSDGGAFSRARMEELYTSHMSDPKVNELVGEIYEHYGKMRSYLLERGMISTRTAQKWLDERPRYAPLQQDVSNDRFLSDVFDSEPFDRMEKSLIGNFKRRKELGKGALEAGEIMDPVKVHEGYLANIIRYTEFNNVRKRIIDELLEGGLTGRAGKPVITLLSREATNTKNTVTIIRSGNKELYKIDDKWLRRAIEIQPNLTVGFLSIPRRFYTELTTGRWRPDFALRSAMYDVWGAIATLPKGMRGAALDQLFAKFFPKMGLPAPRLGGYDPSLLIAPITGTGLQLYGDGLQAMTRMINVGMRSDAAWWKRAEKIFPGANTWLERQSANMMRMYAHSAVGIRQKYGGGNTLFMENIHADSNAIPSALLDYAPAFAAAANPSFRTNRIIGRTNPLLRFYLSFISAIQGSVRLQSFAANVPRDKMGRMMFDDRLLQNMTGESRRLGGDPVVRGGDPSTVIGSAHQILVEEAPYFNQFIQVGSRYAQAFKEQPLTFLGRHIAWAGAAMAGMMYQFEINPVALRRYWGEWSAEQRADMIPILFDKDGNVPMWYAVGPEDRLSWSPFVEAIGQLVGYTTDDPSEHIKMQGIVARILGARTDRVNVDRVKTAFLNELQRSVLPELIGPAPDAALQFGVGMTNLFGSKGSIDLRGIPFGSGQGRVGPGSARRFSDIPEDDPQLWATVEKLVEAIFGGMAATIMMTVEAAKETKDIELTVKAAASYFQAAQRNPINIWGQEIPHGTDPYFDRGTRRIIDNVRKFNDEAQSVRNLESFGAGPRTATNLQGAFRDLSETEFQTVIDHMRGLNFWLANNYSTQYNVLAKEMGIIRRNYYITIRDKTSQLSQRRMAQQKLNIAARKVIEVTERELSILLGRPITFKDASIERLQAPKVKDSLLD